MKSIQVSKGKVPSACKLAQMVNIDHLDTFKCTILSDKKIKTDDIMLAFWTDMPLWIKYLFSIRNSLVKPFGLKGSDTPSKEILYDALKNGKACGIMTVLENTDNETVVCLDDKHLRAYLAVFKTTANNREIVHLSTGVKFHNKMGKVYFTLIKPFHNIIVKQLLKHILAKLYFK